jgi:ribosomal protein L37AE/L43A
MQKKKKCDVVELVPYTPVQCPRCKAEIQKRGLNPIMRCSKCNNKFYP